MAAVASAVAEATLVRVATVAAAQGATATPRATSATTAIAKRTAGSVVSAPAVTDLLARALLALSLAAMPALAGAAATGDCELMLAVERNGAIQLWSAAAGVREVGRGGCAALDPMARRLAWCAPSDEEDWRARVLWILPLGAGSRVERERAYEAPEGAFISEAAWSPDGQRLAFLLTDARFRSHLLVWRDGRVDRIATASVDEDPQWWSLGWLADGEQLTVHDMQRLHTIEHRTGERHREPLLKLGIPPDAMSSSDRVRPAPDDPQLFAFTRMAQGSERLQRVLHEPGSALFLHDRFVGKGKNLRLSDEDTVVVDATWVPDGRSLVFSGYRAGQAQETDPFRLYRIERHGGRAAELTRGERASAACLRPSALPDHSR